MRKNLFEFQDLSYGPDIAECGIQGNLLLILTYFLFNENILTQNNTYATFIIMQNSAKNSL
jgi:hypothetical protein